MHKPHVLQSLIYLSLCILTFACAPTPIVTSAPTVPGTDRELEAAIHQAHDTLDVFIAKIATPQEDQTLIALKVRFYPPGESPQDIWVDHVTYTNGIFRGEMGDDIPTLRLELGEKITIDEANIVDWMIVEDGKLVGGYTIRLAFQRMSLEERERFLKAVDYTMED